METIKYEWDIQKFISEYPWLINLNYQNIPELKEFNKDKEFYIEGNKRIDLILKDSVTGFPVIIEFKRGDLTRDNIGQILEYRSRIIASLNNEDSTLFRLFGNKIVSPKMVLVVRSSDDFGKISCNLQNIDLVEYGNIESKILSGDIGFIKSIDDFSKTIKTSNPPINYERSIYLENNVYSILFNLFKKYGFVDKWRYYNNYDIGEYFWNYKTTFLNKWILKDQVISIGLYEDILFKSDMYVCISFCSKNIEILNKLKELILSEKDNICCECNSWTMDSDFLLDFRYNPNDFYNNDNTEKILENTIKNYLKIVNIK
ncbi:MAG: DUF4263 domain-containing protein [Treponema sp.]|nr:DUF4263 domain-containing protein [Treponema sp.]